MLSGKTIKDSPELIENVSLVNGDLGLVRMRIDKGDKTFSKYSYQSIIFDGVSGNNPRTAGLPVGYAHDRISFPAYDPSGYTLYIASSSGLDTGNFKVYITGLNNDWLEMTEELTLTGTTPVSTVNNNWLRVNKMFVSAVNNNKESNVGDISITNINSFTLGVPDNPPMNMIPADFGYSVIGIFTVPRNKRLYFTRGSFYTDSTPEKPLLTEQDDVYPWDPNNPNVNRISLKVGRLYTSTTVAFNTSGSAPEFPCTDIEFIAKSGKTNQPVNYSVYWNTVLFDIT